MGEIQQGQKGQDCLEICRKRGVNQLETRVTEVDDLKTVLSIQIGIYTQWGICIYSGNRVCAPQFRSPQLMTS